ncbi:PilZ domain-containing protein [Planctomycetota bacterium]
MTKSTVSRIVRRTKVPLKTNTQRGSSRPIQERRVAPRKKLKARASVKIRLSDGSLYATYKSEVVNISTSGMLLKSLAGKGKGLPTQPFYLEIDLTETKKKFPQLKAKPVRFDKPKQSATKYGLGVRFIDIPEDDDQLLKFIAEAKEKYRKS